MSHRQFTLLLFCLCAFVGCKSIDATTDKSANDKSWWDRTAEPAPETPAKIVAIWSNSVFNEPGTKPVRGLGGRLYFYDAKHQPICVDGKLAVFLYDDTEPGRRKDQEATKQIHFSPEQVAGNYTPTEFGPSYSFWLPWDEVGGERKHLSVIPVFTSNEGEMLVGDQARYLLPGKERVELAETTPESGNVMAASFEADGTSSQIAQTNASEAEARPSSTRIKLPPSVQRRLRMSKASPQLRPNRRVSDASGLRKSDLRISNLRQTEIRSTPIDNQAAKMESTQPAKIESRGFGTFDSKADTLSTGSADKEARVIQPIDSQPDPRQVQAMQSSQQETSPVRNPLSHAMSLFSR